jgi:Predicted RNA methylase
MPTKSGLTQRLGVVVGFSNPRAALEQYRTPPRLAAEIVHLADLQDDIAGQTVFDLGCGTGMLALGAALRGPNTIVGIDLDRAPLATAVTNERRIGSTTSISWLHADATQPPITPVGSSTVVMNPPFGAQAGNEHADRAFLNTAAVLSSVSYSVHNADSKAFVESFAADHGGHVTHAFRTEYRLPATYEFHTETTRTIDVEVFRIVWSNKAEPA